MDLLARTRGVERFVMIGICSGATISYMTAKADERVSGVVMINAQSHLHGMDPDLGDHLRERTIAAHSWRIALRSSFRKKNWRKALGGELDPMRILRMMVGIPMSLLLRGREQKASAKAYDSAADLRAVTDRGIKLYHLYSEGDEGLDYFNVVLSPEEQEECKRGNSRFEVLLGANHVFTLLWSQDELVKRVLDWARTEAR
jgi:pimeloyl-ACP methyl ester carboxylesterase